MWLRNSAFVVLVIYGCLYILAGASDVFLLPLRLGHRGSSTLAGLIVMLIAAGTLMRLRVAAILLALLSAFMGIKGSVANPQHFSAMQITCILIFTFLPIVVTIISWKRLRWLPKPSNQALEPTPDQREN